MKRLIVATLVAVVLTGCGQKRRQVTPRQYNTASELYRDAEIKGAQTNHAFRQLEANPGSPYYKEKARQSLHDYARSVKRMQDYDKQLQK